MLETCIGTARAVREQAATNLKAGRKPARLGGGTAR